MKRFLIVLMIFLVGFLSFESCKSKKKPVKKKHKTQVNKPKPVTKIYPSGNDNKKLYKVVNEWLGTPYKYGGCDKNGVDCSGFVMNVYKEVYGIDLYRSAYDIMKNVYFVEKSEIKEGDILFFITGKENRVSHVGIYLKDGQFVHSSTSKGVMISRIDEPYYQKAFHKAGRHQKVP